MRVVVVLILLVLFPLSGCSTPLFSTDNKFLLQLPGAERRSDEVAGVLRPWERLELIEEKGERGTLATPERKVILIEQLIAEYQQTLSPNIRRATVEALGKIGRTTADPKLESVFAKAIYDENLGVRLSGVHAWGIYCTTLPKKDISHKIEARTKAAEHLCTRFSELPYSIAAGSQKENDQRKDLRLAILRSLESFKVSDSDKLLSTLDEALRGEKIDDGALQNAAMRTLGKVTDKKYGLDAQDWSEYLDFAANKRSAPPKELSPIERIATPDLPMFK